MANFWRTFHHDGKISPAGWEWGGGRLPTPFHCIYHHEQSILQVFCSWEARYTPLISTLPLYVLCGTDTLPLFLLYPSMYAYSVAYITNLTPPDIKLLDNIFYTVRLFSTPRSSHWSLPITECYKTFLCIKHNLFLSNVARFIYCVFLSIHTAI